MIGSLHARLVSSLIAADVRRTGLIGRVHSVFRRAVNVELPGGELVTLATPHNGALPNGLVLDMEVDLRPLVFEGARLTGDGHRLLCANLAVDLAGAHVWSPVLQPRGRLRPLAELRAPLAKALQQHSVASGFAEPLRLLADGAPLDKALVPWPALGALLLATQGYDRQAAASAAQRLIGLGPGLTPSGDDALVGYCAALRATEHPLHSWLAEECWRMSHGQTTRIAEIFFAHAQRGAFSERIHRLIAALTDPAADLRTLFEHALAWGASSGADCVLGVLLGAEAAQHGTFQEAA